MSLIDRWTAFLTTGQKNYVRSSRIDIKYVATPVGWRSVFWVVCGSTQVYLAGRSDIKLGETLRECMRPCIKSIRA